MGAPILGHGTTCAHTPTDARFGLDEDGLDVVLEQQASRRNPGASSTDDDHLRGFVGCGFDGGWLLLHLLGVFSNQNGRPSCDSVAS
jgi:hypothetical protein